jgi:hypothetical protein
MRNRNKRIWARLNDNEYSSFKRHVEQSGLSQEAYVRFLINDMVPMPKPPPDYFAMTRELRAISMSIRQIASKASSLHVIEADEFSKYSGKLDKQISAIQDAVELPERRK